MYTLNIKTSKGDVSVSWNNLELLASCASIQAGRYLKSDTSNINLHQENFKNWNQMFWTQRENMGAFDLPKAATIVDIGAGASIVDLLLYSYIPHSKFYLIDGDSWNISFKDGVTPSVCFSENYPVYNSWQVVLDAIRTSNFNRDRFVLLSPASEFPKEVDAITSYFSYCFHYPKEVYWNKILASLKKGGKLILDVRLLKSKDVIGEISEEMKCEPVKFVLPELPKYTDDYEIVEQGIIGYRCMWTRN